MLQPPKEVSQAQIPSREYIFIVDVSGSMHGFPLDTSKELLKNLIGSLRATDMFNVILFSGAYVLLSEQSLPATPDNISKAIQTIDQQRGGRRNRTAAGHGACAVIEGDRKLLAFRDYCHRRLCFR